MENQVKKICQSGYFHICNINGIRKYLSKEHTEKLIHAFVSSRLDNCNSLLYGISKNLLHRLQLIQNAAARTVCLIPKYDHISPSLRMLHWLPIEQRIIYKVCWLTWKARHGYSPQYIRDLLINHDTHSRGLRSANKNLLVIPKSSTKTFGDRSFSVAAPYLWNKLPMQLKSCNEMNRFKSLLKTHLFNEAFN